MELSNGVGTVTVSVPCTSALPDLQVDGSTTALCIRDKNGSTLLDAQQLFSTVDASKTAVEIRDGRLVVTLHKLDPKLKWTTLGVAEEEPIIDARKAEASPEQALAAREAVKRVFEAALEGDVEKLRQAAQSVGNEGIRSVKDGNGRNALHFAAQGGSTAAIEYLLKSEGIGVNAQDESGETALALAAGANNLEAVKILLKNGGSCSQPASPQPQPLHRAAATGGQEVIQALLAAGADPNAPSSAGTPLLWAAGSGNQAAVTSLLDAKADPNARTEDGIGAMLMAAAAGNTAVIEALGKQGADANLPAAGGVTALHAAAEVGELAAVKALLKAGANPNAEEAEGSKPIHAAASAGQRAVVEFLLPQTANQGQPWTVESLLADSSSGGSPPSLQQPGKVPLPEDPEPEKASSSKRAGDEAFVTQNFTKAAEHYTQSLRHATDVPAVWANRSAANLRRGEAAQALSDAQTARSLDPKYMKAWYREGEAAKAMGKYEDAAQAYFQAFTLDPNNREVAHAFQKAVDSAKRQHNQLKNVSNSNLT